MSTPSVSPERGRPMWLGFLRRVRLSTLLLLVPIVALSIGLYAQSRRQAQLQDMLSIYRQPRTEGIHDALDQVITLTYADGAELSDVLKDVKGQTSNHPKLPKIPTGIPIYVDPMGLQEAETSLSAPVRKPSGADKLTLGEHLQHILDPLGLSYVVKDGFLMITSKDSQDVLEHLGGEEDPYLQYRDVLR